MIIHKIPVATNTRAIALSGLLPQNSSMIVFVFDPSQGIIQNCVRGHTRKAVRGEAIFSILWESPKTLPCLCKGTTFWKIVCSLASTKRRKCHKSKKTYYNEPNRSIQGKYNTDTPHHKISK